MKNEMAFIVIIAGLTLAFFTGIVGIFWLILAFGLLTGIWVFLRDINLNFREREADIRSRETDANFKAVSCRHGIVTLHNDSLYFFTKESGMKPESKARIGGGVMEGKQEKLTHDTAPELEPELSRRPPVLPLIINAPCVLIHGGRNRGKTNLARFVMEHRAKSEDILIIDPKQSALETWAGYRVAGANHNYAEIMEALEQVNRLGNHKITILIDEMTILKMRIPNFADYWLQALIEGRERGQNIWIIGQSKTAGSLGLKGAYDLIDCFDYLVGCQYTKSTGERFCEVEESGVQKRIMGQPGEYQGSEQ